MYSVFESLKEDALFFRENIDIDRFKLSGEYCAKNKTLHHTGKHGQCTMCKDCSTLPAAYTASSITDMEVTFCYECFPEVEDNEGVFENAMWHFYDSIFRPVGEVLDSALYLLHYIYIIEKYAPNNLPESVQQKLLVLNESLRTKIRKHLRVANYEFTPFAADCKDYVLIDMTTSRQASGTKESSYLDPRVISVVNVLSQEEAAFSGFSLIKATPEVRSTLRRNTIFPHQTECPTLLSEVQLSELRVYLEDGMSLADACSIVVALAV